MRKMKKLGVLVFGFVVQALFAQANRFVYQVTMKTDSTAGVEPKSETAYLDISASQSIFYGELRMRRDSMFARMRQTNNFNFDRKTMGSFRSDINYTIDKDYKTGKIIYTARIMRDTYSYVEDRPMKWNVLPEMATIGEYKTQKAETDFAGRKWYAWFTTEIPSQDGPYKFSGLPGLIIKVESADQDYSFDLKESKKINELPEFSQRSAPIVVKRSVFVKQEEQFRKDPVVAFSGSGPGFRFQMDPNQRKQMEERIKEESKKNNNPIERN